MWTRSVSARVAQRPHGKWAGELWRQLRSAGNKEMQGGPQGWAVKTTPGDGSAGPKAKGKWQRTEGRNCWTGNMSVPRKEAWEEGQFWHCLAYPSLEQGWDWGWHCQACERLVRYKGNSMQILIQETTRSEMHHHLYQAPLTMCWNGLCLVSVPLPRLWVPQGLNFITAPVPCTIGHSFAEWTNERTNSAPQLCSPILASFSFLCCFWF